MLESTAQQIKARRSDALDRHMEHSIGTLHHFGLYDTTVFHDASITAQHSNAQVLKAWYGTESPTTVQH